MEYSNAQQMRQPVRKIYWSRKGIKLSKYTGLNKNTKSIKQQVQRQGIKQEDKTKREISELVIIVKFKASAFTAPLNKLETIRDRKVSYMLNFCPE